MQRVRTWPAARDVEEHEIADEAEGLQRKGRTRSKAVSTLPARKSRHCTQQAALGGAGLQTRRSRRAESAESV